MRDVIVIIVGLFLFVLVWGVWIGLESQGGFSSPKVIEQCPADARLCPDGSAVGRVPPHCEFAECAAEGEALYVE